MPSVAIDWDDTLVSVKSKEWLEGSVLLLHQLKGQGVTIIIHSCRAGWDEGKREIEDKLMEIGFVPGKKLKIEPKPNADIYVDDKAHRFTGDHFATIDAIREAVA